MKIRFFIALIVLFFSLNTWSLDTRWGVMMGFGGAGLKKKENLGASEVQVERSENPGVGGLFFETALTADFVLGVEHTRGFRLAPFSTGMGLTGFTGKWYYDSQVPSIRMTKIDSQSLLLIKRTVPFVGGSVGLASGEISRDDDQVRSASASGIYFGFRGGIDYQYLPGIVFRPEVFYSTTLSSFDPKGSQVSEFGLVFGVVFLP